MVLVFILTCPIPQMWTSSSSSSPLPVSRPLTPSLSKTMEQVWEDIALTADLHHHPPSAGVILQDFFSNEPPPPTTNLTLSTVQMQPGKKRVPGLDRSSGEHRHKRMIKNRESAARSRARKQAYTIELEYEIAHLIEENDKLKKHQEQQQLLRAAAAAERLMKMKKKEKALQRTLTAPF